ncbi:hypothetical protein G7046_g9257 [Stylonectria norvegica]|nr:hypothetical protein G7046_g9257 [Stylonectria norvegica]
MYHSTSYLWKSLDAEAPRAQHSKLPQHTTAALALHGSSSCVRHDREHIIYKVPLRSLGESCKPPPGNGGGPVEGQQWSWASGDGRWTLIVLLHHDYPSTIQTPETPPARLLTNTGGRTTSRILLAHLLGPERVQPAGLPRTCVVMDPISQLDSVDTFPFQFSMIALCDDGTSNLALIRLALVQSRPRPSLFESRPRLLLVAFWSQFAMPSNDPQRIHPDEDGPCLLGNALALVGSD